MRALAQSAVRKADAIVNVARSRYLLAAAALALLGVLAACSREESGIVIGSKSFTESVILGDVLTLLAADAGATARHRRGLGGTRLVFNALAAGDIDAYVEYTGTLTEEIFAGEDIASEAELEARLGDLGIVLAGSVGFENNYALGMPAKVAETLAVSAISDLRRHPELRIRVSNEFMERADGWPGLRDFYALPQTDVRGVDHDIAYRALEAGDAELTELYTTDAEIDYYGLATLVDDLGYFPRYEAVLLRRADLDTRVAGGAAALERIVGTMTAARMAAMNAAVKLEARPEAGVAAEFLSDELGITTAIAQTSLGGRVLARTREHLLLVALSLLTAVLAAVPLGIIASKRERFGQALIGVVGIGQTIPALALLVILVPPLGIGAGPALVALFIYSLLPIVRNTHAGIVGVPALLQESADALGLPAGAKLRRIELPLALPTILAGIKTAAVINVGGATLGALVGAGGYGQPILTGIRLDDTQLILEGAVPAAVLALAVQWIFERAERALVPRGIRQNSARHG